MNLRTILAVFLLIFTLTVCADPPPVAAAKPAVPTERFKDPVVRISVGGQHAGSGIVISKGDGYIVTDLRIIERSYGSTGDLMVDGTIPAKLVELDRVHGLALIWVDAVFRNAAPLYERANRGGRVSESVRVVGYSDVLSEPPMVEKRMIDASVMNFSYHGESVTALDLSDICLVGNGDRWRDSVDERGAAVFMAESGKLLGISIGKMRSGELMVMPAEAIKALLGRHAPPN